MTADQRRARFERALLWGGNTHSLADIADLLRDGKARWWGGDSDGMIVTELLDFPQYRAVNYWMIAGSLPDCLALDAEISDWAIQQGCAVAVASGRRGWGRVSAPLGWRPRNMEMFYKPLTMDLPDARSGSISP